MGVLDRWDRRNQETLEWHGEVDRRERAGDPAFQPLTIGKFLLIGLAVAALRRILDAWFDGPVVLAVLFGLSAVAFVVAVVLTRRKRREWTAGRSTREGTD